MAVVEAGLANLRDEHRIDRAKRDQEHRENRELLLGIRADVHAMTDHEKRLDSLEDWRQNLGAEFRGALRIPRTILVLTPIVGIALTIITILRG